MALSRCVYIVEDDEAVACSLAALLQWSGYRTERFGSADLLLARADALAPGSLLIDYALPGTNGLAAVEALRARGVLWPAILMTGYDLTGLEEEAQRAGVHCVIEKPFDVNQLSSKLAAITPLVPAGAIRRSRCTRRPASGKRRSTAPTRHAITSVLAAVPPRQPLA